MLFKRPYFCVLLLLFILTVSPIFATEESSNNLPNGYSTVTLGMSVEEAKEALKKSPAFGYNGNQDVSLLPGENRTLITTDGVLFFNECWFQFDNDRLYIITLNLNPEQIDYYSIFKTLCDKYGEPISLSPEKSEWNNGTVQMVLERPLALKYTDVAVFNELQESSNVRESAQEFNRQNFLDSL
ncbi:MAG: hypothetical protein J6B32_06630 [Spirochaetaceae bacterium]|nr:hypothetical protein [Spirochaetaceae bacterium]